LKIECVQKGMFRGASRSFAAPPGRRGDFAAACGGTPLSPHIAAEVTVSPQLAAEVTVSPQLAAEVTVSPQLAAEVTLSPQLAAEAGVSPHLAALSTLRRTSRSFAARTPALRKKIPRIEYLGQVETTSILPVLPVKQSEFD
jgi:hypothetical protein